VVIFLDIVTFLSKIFVSIVNIFQSMITGDQKKGFENCEVKILTYLLKNFLRQFFKKWLFFRHAISSEIFAC
jgi:hypothetical protein